MDKRGSRRLAGVSGILFVVLTYTSVILGDTPILGGLGEPPPGAGGEEWVAYFTISHTALLVKSYLWGLAFCFFLVFVGGLCGAVWGARAARAAGVGRLWWRSNGDRFAAGIFGGVLGGGA